MCSFNASEITPYEFVPSEQSTYILDLSFRMFTVGHQSEMTNCLDRHVDFATRQCAFPCSPFGKAFHVPETKNASYGTSFLISCRHSEQCDDNPGNYFRKIVTRHGIQVIMHV
jgi:hypothetical protein